MKGLSKRARMESAAALGMTMLVFVMLVPIVVPFIPARAATNHVVDMNDYNFSPQFLTVASGDTVTWHNAGAHVHTATSNTSAWAEITLSAGQTSSPVTMPLTPGNYTYICSYHFSSFGMWGAIVVSTVVPEFSGSLVVVVGMLAIALGMMLIIRRP